MKKFLSLSICALCTFTANAQMGSIAPNWSKKVTTVENAGDAYRQAPVAVTADGTVYATGKFNQLVITDKFILDPIAQSSFLAKYAADGSEVWAVALAGTATITSIATDEDENIYIAGTLADKVVFNTTSGESQTLEGWQADDGSYISEEYASFIAKYDANGVLKATQTFKTATNADILDYVDNFYFYLGENDKFTIKHIEIANGKVNASALFIGQAEIDGKTIQSSLNDTEGWMVDDVQHYILFNMDLDLTGFSVLAELRPTEKVQASEIIATPKSMTFTCDAQGNYYIGGYGYGHLTLTTAEGDKDFVFENSDEEGIAYGYILAKYGANTNLTKTYVSTSDNSSKGYENIGAMEVHDNILYLGGVCYGTLAYDPSKEATGTFDLYAVALNADNLETIWAAVSGVDEGEVYKFGEVFTTMTVSNDNVYLYGCIEETATYATQSSLNYICNNGNMTSCGSALVTGSATDGNHMILALLDDTQSVFNSYTVTGDGVQDAITQTGISRNGNTFSFAQPCDVVIYNMQGQAVAKAYNVSKMNLDALANGCYVAKIVAAEATSTCKFIKK